MLTRGEGHAPRNHNGPKIRRNTLRPWSEFAPQQKLVRAALLSHRFVTGRTNPPIVVRRPLPKGGSVAERTVEVTVDAEPDAVPVVRNVAADLATRMDLQLDTIADLRLAVDEACGILLEHAFSPATLHCRFIRTATTITTRVEVPSSDGSSVPQEGFSWYVLNALVDSVDSFSDVRASDDARVVVIEFSVGNAEHVTLG